MNYVEMKNELMRVENVFSKKYHDEIVKLFWNEFKNLSVNRFVALVDIILETARFAPTLADFKKANSELRHTEYQQEKQQRVKEINEEWPKTKATQDQISAVFKECINKLRGKENFNEDVYGKDNYDCKMCKDTGDVFAKHKTRPYGYMFRCRCAKGLESTPIVPRWHSGLLTSFTLA